MKINKEIDFFFIESLDELEEMVVDLFSDVPNYNIEIPSWPEHPFTEKECKKIAYIVPVKDIRNMNITFPIPDLRPYYKTSVRLKFFALLNNIFSCL